MMRNCCEYVFIRIKKEKKTCYDIVNFNYLLYIKYLGEQIFHYMFH